MEEVTNIFDKSKSFAAEFRKNYERKFDIPTFKIIKSFFHPALPDHVIALNEINFPKVSADKITTLVHDKMQGNDVLEKIQNTYMPRVESQQAAIRNKLVKNTFRKHSRDSESLPEEPDSAEWEKSSDSTYEGGKEDEEEHSDSPDESIPKKKKVARIKRYRVNRSNEILIDMIPKVKGQYPKILTKNAEDKINNENMQFGESYNYAIDLLMEEENNILSYQDFDESMKTIHREIGENGEQNIDRKYGINLNFNKLPEYQGANYVPPPFRHKYELCIWKIDTHNVAKIRNKYFTPEAFHTDEYEGSFLDIDVSLDNKTLVVSSNKAVEEQQLILVFNIYTLDKIAELSVNVCNPSYLISDYYDPMYDAYSPEAALSYRTQLFFPRVHCWNEGKYV